MELCEFCLLWLHFMWLTLHLMLGFWYVCKVDFMPVIFMWKLGFKNSIYVVERRGNSVFWGFCVNFKLVLQRLKEWVRCAIFMGCSFGSHFCVGWFLSCKIKKWVQKFSKYAGIFGVFGNLLVLVGFSVADFAFYV